MSAATPLLDNTIEADEPTGPTGPINTGHSGRPRVQDVLKPTNHGLATTESDAESGIAGIFRQVTKLILQDDYTTNGAHSQPIP